MKLVQRVEVLENYLGRVRFPLNPYSYDTKAALELLFEKDAFLNLCYNIFGNLQVSALGQEIPLQTTWMDEVNRDPNGAAARALFRFLAPGGHFCNVLEALSGPPLGFVATLKRDWRGGGGEIGVGGDFTEELAAAHVQLLRRRVDFPLAGLCPFSFQLLAEASDTDLFSLPRSRCPPLLVVPFWDPPMLTRTEPTQKKVMTSLPCSPLAYFLLRLLSYGNAIAGTSGADIIFEPGHGTSFYSTVIGFASRFLGGSSSTDVAEAPFYHRLLVAYIQYYVTPSLAQKMHGYVRLEEVPWTSTDAIAALLLNGVPLLGMRRTRFPECESQRGPYRDLATTASLLEMLPILTVLIFALGDAVPNQPPQGFVQALEFSQDSVAVASADVLMPGRVLYRFCLAALRSTFLSLEHFSRCRRRHFINAFELWHTLLSSCDRMSKEPREVYVAQHYEAFSYILVDALTCVSKSSFLNCVDSVSAVLLSRCLAVFTETAVQSVLREMSTACEGVRGDTPVSLRRQEGAPVTDTIAKSFVLNWIRQDGTIHVMNAYGVEVAAAAAQAAIAIEEFTTSVGLQPSRPHASETQPLAVDHLRRCVTILTTAFPLITPLMERMRQVPLERDTPYERSAAFDNQSLLGKLVDGLLSVGGLRIVPNFHDSGEGAGRPSGMGCSRQSGKMIGPVTKDAKRKYFAGGKVRWSLDASRHVRFSTHYGTFAGTGNPAVQDVSSSDEFPCFVWLTRGGDYLIELAQVVYYGRQIPRCNSGHCLTLLNTAEYACSNHQYQAAIWECALCEVVYGACCRMLPTDSRGRQLVPVAGPGTDSEVTRYCCLCRMLVPCPSTIMFSPAADGSSTTLRCSRCASMPFQQFSIRFMASYAFTLCICAVSLLVWIVLHAI